MAFLDNSGDIILDAVLTDLGREKMAAGGFKVKYFALGDDEVDYTLYNKNHSSGSAYYDLEILQTPILEAFTQTNAAINYGLLSTTATELLYMPVMATNDNTLGGAVRPKQAKTGGDIYWLTDTSNDARAATAVSAILRETGTAATTDEKNGYMEGNTNNYFILIENGLNTTKIKGTAQNTTSYLDNYGLVDDSYYVYYDNRLMSTVYGSDGATLNNSKGGTGQVTVAGWTAATSISLDLGLENYSAVRIQAFQDKIYYSESNTTDDTSVSAISGPRGNFTVLSLFTKPDLGAEYSLYGNTNNTTLFGSAVDFIDTTVYVQGASTGATLQLPIRIVRAYVA
jgi:hypothetical protein